MDSPSPSSSYAGNFGRQWQSATEDNNVTLYGFRRFKTSHLLNLRILEDEITDLDHDIYQAGLSLDCEISSTDRLQLRHAKRDAHAPKVEEVVTEKNILRLRDLLKQYDDALMSFQSIMAMETFSLLDDEKRSTQRTDLNLEEIYVTRMVRVDLDRRSRTDPFQRRIHRWLRAFRYWRLSKVRTDPECPTHLREKGWSYQNTAFVADVVGRGVTAIVTATFLLVPLALLLGQPLSSKDFVVVAVSIVVFAAVVAIAMKASNFEMMTLAAAYAAVLSTFVSNLS